MVRAKEILAKTEKQNFLNGFDFSIAVQDLLISEDGWVIDTGTYENVNAECLIRLMRKIEKHPLIWKLFFYDCVKVNYLKEEEYVQRLICEMVKALSF